MTDNRTISRLERIEKDIAELKKAVFGDQPHRLTRKRKQGQKFDFSVNIRAYVKRYVAGKGGPRKFVMLLAYLAKGKVGKNIKLSEIQAQWNKMSGKNLMGKFNRFYPNEAKTRGLVDSKEYGTYCLTEEWEAN